MRARGTALFVFAASLLAACDDPVEEAPPPDTTISFGGEGRPIEVIQTHYGTLTSEPSVTPGTPELDGALSAQAVTTVFVNRETELTACYAHALEGAPEVPPVGSLTVTFTIAATGAVVAPVTIGASSSSLPAFDACVAQTVGAWTFPGASGDTHVSAPLQLLYAPPPG